MSVKLKKCKHEKEPKLVYFTKKGIPREGMKCPDCGLLLDYYPQYNED